MGKLEETSVLRKGPQLRQRCEFCRVRKIRCNAGQPCSNCCRRAIKCHYVSQTVWKRVFTATTRSLPTAGIGTCAYMHTSTGDYEQLVVACPPLLPSPPPPPPLVAPHVAAAAAAAPPSSVAPKELMRFYVGFYLPFKFQHDRDSLAELCRVTMVDNKAIMSSTLALAAHEYSKRTGTLVPEMIDYKWRALSDINADISAGRVTEHTIVAIANLLSLEVADHGLQHWVMHLRGALAVCGKLDLAPLVVQKQIYSCRVIGMTLQDLDFCIESRAWRPNMPSNKLNVIDVRLQCSFGLLNMIHDIILHCRLAWDGRVSESENSAPSLRELVELKQYDVSHNAYTELCADLFKKGAIVLSRHGISGLEPESPVLAASVKDCLNTFRKLRVEGSPRPYPLWPMFISGCLCAEEDRMFVLTQLYKVGSLWFPRSNVDTSRLAIEAIWRCRDLNVAPPTGGPRKSFIWDDFVQHWTLSLL